MTSVVFLEQTDFYTQMDHVIAYIYQQVLLNIFHLLFCILVILVIYIKFDH